MQQCTYSLEECQFYRRSFSSPSLKRLTHGHTVSLLWLCTCIRPGHTKVIPAATFSEFGISTSTFLMTKMVTGNILVKTLIDKRAILCTEVANFFFFMYKLFIKEYKLQAMMRMPVKMEGPLQSLQ